MTSLYLPRYAYSFNHSFFHSEHLYSTQPRNIITGAQLPMHMTSIPNALQDIYLITSAYFGFILQGLLFIDSYIHIVLTRSEKTET